MRRNRARVSATKRWSGLLPLLLLAACGSHSEFVAENFKPGLNDYLQQRGNLCLAKYDWPIDIAASEFAAGSRNALQMPVLEKLGLVTSTEASVDQSGTQAESGAASVAAPLKLKRYALTELGKKYYVTRSFTSAVGEAKVERADLCVAKLSLDKIVAVEKLGKDAGTTAASVTYTYNLSYDVDAAAWTSDADFDRVFPMIDRIVHGARRVQLKQSFNRSGDGWVASDLLK